MNFNFEINNFGRISNLDLDIKPFTVIAGINNSGKSFVTKGLYSLLSSLNIDHITHIFEKEYSEIIWNIDKITTYLRAKSDLNKIENIKEQVQYIKNFSDKAFHIDLEQQLEMANDRFSRKIIDEIINNFNNFVTSIKSRNTIFKNINFYIERISSSLNIVRTTISNPKLSLTNSITDSLSDNLIKNFQVPLDSLYNYNITDDKISFKLENIGEIEVNKGNVAFKLNQNGIINIQKLHHIVYLDSPVFMRIKKALKSIRTPDALRLLLNKRDMLKHYPKYVDDIYTLTESNFVKTNELSDITENINKAIGGKVIIDDNGNVLFDEYGGKQIPLASAAMGIANIGIIAMLLENELINKNSFLILDEPEAHLHPEWQVLMVKILYSLSKKGVNIVIATHSLEVMKYLDCLIEQEDIDENSLSLNLISDEIDYKSFKKKSLLL